MSAATSIDPTPDRDPRPLLIASNRLPVSLKVTGDTWTAAPSAGGLVTALGGLDGKRQWFGWPGANVPEALEESVRKELAQHDLVPVFLGEEEERLYYRGLSNTVLWPLFHYFTGRVEYEEEEWEAYSSVNEKFARTLADHAPHGARVWIHDFHLMLMPAQLRGLRPDLEIGFFLHIPFPSSEIYRLLPRREELLLGLLGADHVGFHTSDYARHFRSTCVRVLGLDGDLDELRFDNRVIGIGVHPIGIDTDGFKEFVGSTRTAALYDELRGRYGDRKVLLGVERLDYTKGVLLKMRAFEQFLCRDPKRVNDVVMLQLLVPSRLNHPEYQGLKAEIEETVGRINGTFGRPGINPVDYMHRSVDKEELVALYRLAAAGLVTPIRDGMNLVAQEFVCCQAAPSPEMPANNGILILSEFAGAAHSLTRSLLVNPWNLAQVADAIDEALAMDPAERSQRMGGMARTIDAMNSSVWAASFVKAMGRSGARNNKHGSARPLDEDSTKQVVAAYTSAPERQLFLDYDGTLRELAPHPEDATPSAELRGILRDLSQLPNTRVHVVSGRPRETLEMWLGDLPIDLGAEHGYCWRTADGRWHELDDQIDLSWMPHVRAIFEEISREVHGSFMEQKRASLGWHYRMADIDYGSWRARELRAQLEEELSSSAAEVLPGRKIVEVRAAGIHKGGYLRRVLSGVSDDAFILCMGDDRTDQDMYRALSEHAWTIHVGHSTDAARFTVESPRHVRQFLTQLIAAAIPAQT